MNPSDRATRPLLPRRSAWRLFGPALLLALSACGFAMRGVTPLPFETLYIGIPDNTRFGADVRRALRATSPGTAQVDQPKAAQVQLQQVSLDREAREVSLNAQGRVEEYELVVRLVFRLVDANGRVLLPDTTLTAIRDVPYDDQIAQAKEGEMRNIYRDMQTSLVSRLVRRLTAPDVAEAFATSQAGDPSEQLEVAPVLEQPSGGYDPAPWSTPEIDSGPRSW